MKIKDLKKCISAEELAALTEYAAKHGLRWRAALRREWMTESGSPLPTLRELRNRVGPSGLDRIRL